MIYDVFISYRRDGGFDTAGRICDLLDQDGYSVSYDIDTLREGRFDKQLLERVEQCVDFILIVDKHAFDRIVDPASDPKDDWLRQELAYALKLKKNVIPVLLAGAKFPKDLPEDIREVAYCQGPKHSNEYFDSFYEKLKSYMHALPRKGADPDSENRSYFSPNASLPNLKIKSDMDCIFYLDGEETARVKAGSIQKIPLDVGEYELRFVSAENPADFLETKFEMPGIDKLLHVHLCPIRDKRRRMEAKAERKRSSGRLKELKTRSKDNKTPAKTETFSEDELIVLPSSKPETKEEPRNRLPWIIGGAVAAVVLLIILLALLLGKGKKPIEEPVDPCEDAIAAASLILTNDSIRELYNLEDYVRAVPALNIGWDTLSDCDPELSDQYVKHVKRVFDKELEKAYGKNNAISIIQNGYSYTFFADTNIYNRMVELSQFHGFDDTGCKLPPDPKTNQTFEVNGVPFKMIYVEGGTFTMGCTSEQGSDCFDEEKPAHNVTLSTYYIGETEVTQELWNAVMGSNTSYFKGDSRPVENVSWNDCQEFIRRLNELTGNNFRLPTEAEWEFAARGGKKSAGYKYSGSNNINTVAWYKVNAYDIGEDSPDYGTHVVKTKERNELGIYDMSGNVWEWCSDWYAKYNNANQSKSKGTDSDFNRVARGGCWGNSPEHCRSSRRYSNVPSYQSRYLGLRLVLRPYTNSSSATRSSNNSNAQSNRSSATRSSNPPKKNSLKNGAVVSPNDNL